jgi:tetratricopeptide (TPR) repeat protein
MPQVIDVLREDNPFVGREKEQQAYTAFINAQGEDPPWLLVFSGLGGIGKSTLLKHFRQLTPADQTTLLDFNTEIKAAQLAAEGEHISKRKSSLLYDPSIRTDPLQFLTLLAMELQPHCDAARYAAFTDMLERSRTQLERLPEPMLQSSQNSPGAAVRPPDLSDDDLQAIHLSNLEVRRQTRELVTEAFYAQVETFAPERLIIMLDTCELLNEPDSWGFCQWLMNAFLPTLHERMWRCPCYIIMASRTPLESSTILEQEQKLITLSLLEKNAVNTYLEQIGVDPSWYDRVYSITRGHALYVAIIGKLYQENGPALFQDMYSSSQDGSQAVQKELARDVADLLIQKRILKNLKPPFDDLTQYGVILRVFTLPLLRVIFPALLPETNASSIFDQFIRYPYIESKGNYRYVFHELIREVLAKEIQKRHPTEWRSYNERAFSYFTSGTSHTMDWYYHNLARNEIAGIAYDREGITAWQEAIREARECKDTQRVSSLLQITNDVALNLSNLSCAACAYEWGLYYYADRILSAKAFEKYQLALTLYEQATVFPEESKWARQPEAIEQEIRRGKIDLLQAMGDVRQSDVALDDATSYYQQALDLLHQDESHAPEDEAHLLIKIGDVAQLYKEPHLLLALDSYTKALALFRQIGNTTQVARTLKRLGDVQRSQQHPREATDYYNQALKIFQAAKDRSKSDEAALLQAMGDTEQLYRDASALKAALDFYQQAFGLCEDSNLRKQIKQAIDKVQLFLHDEVTQSLPSEPPLAASPPAASALQSVSAHTTPTTRKRPRMLFVVFAMILLILIVFVGIFSFFPPQSHLAATPAPIRAGQAIYNQAIQTPPVLNDALSNNSGSNGWEEIQYPDIGGVSGCSFSSGTAYHATAARTSYSQLCFAQNTNFYNFAYQVGMTTTGDVGGIIFRANEQNASYYLFGIGTDGSYFLSLSSGTTRSQDLVSGTSSTIHRGSQSNTLAVITSKDSIYLYINGQYINQASDNTFDNSLLPHGQIGVFAENHTSLQTDVAFSQAKVWMNAQDTAQSAATTTRLQALDAQTKELYAQVTSKPPTLQDPLTSSGTNKWEVDQTPQGDGCLFIGGAYHAIMPMAKLLEYCEETAQQFHNFAYQATMTIFKGNVGGIMFDGAGVGKPQFYYFEINIADSSYFFARHMGANISQIKTLRASSSAAIHANLNVPNTLTVIAQDGTFYLYINSQFVDKVQDSTFKSGNIGVVADNFGNSTDIVFSDAKVWKLAREYG